MPSFGDGVDRHNLMNPYYNIKVNNTNTNMNTSMNTNMNTSMKYSNK